MSVSTLRDVLYFVFFPGLLGKNHVPDVWLLPVSSPPDGPILTVYLRWQGEKVSDGRLTDPKRLSEL